MIRKTVLIADDATSLRQVVNFKLRLSGYKTLMASSLQEALDVIKEHRIHLILLDILFEEEKLNGLDFLSILHDNPKYSKIPVIVLTILKDEKTRQQAERLGAKDFITKPFSVNTLLNSIHQHIA